MNIFLRSVWFKILSINTRKLHKWERSENFFMDENLGLFYFEVIWFVRQNRL